MSFTGLEQGSEKELPEFVEISLNLERYSWVSTKVRRDVEEIKKAIDSLLKPYFIGESAINMNQADKLKNSSDDFKFAWQKWLTFLSENGKSIKSVQQKNEAIEGLLRLSNYNEELAIDIIIQSISRGWLGFFEIIPDI